MKTIVFLMGLLTSLSLTAQQFSVQAGTSVVASGSPAMVFHSLSLQQEGQWLPAQSSLYLTGSSATTLTGTAPISLYRMVLDKASQVQLGTNVTLSDQLWFSQGKLDLNGNELNLGTTGYLSNEQESSRLVSSAIGGEVVRWVTYTSPILADSGSLGVEISTANALGLTEIRRGHFPPTLPGGSGMERYVQLSPTQNSGLNASIRLSYFEVELNGQLESELQFFQSTDGGSTWTSEGFSTKDLAENVVELDGLNSMGSFTLANVGTFPVEWLGFRGEKIGQQVRCEWTIAMEQDLTHYELERSSDGQVFEPILRMNSLGNSETARTYTGWDRHPLSGINYYQLKAWQLDGTYLLSKQISVQFETGSAFVLAPNPTHSSAELQAFLPQAIVGYLQIYDTQGQLLHQQTINLPSGTSVLPLTLENFAKGMYLIRVIGGQFSADLPLLRL
ncbi:MAG: T9SS type A sorting domain-containing protein [Bacteroidota bacterium]